MAHPVGQARAHHEPAHGVVHRPPPRRARLRGRDARLGCRGDHLEPDPEPPGRPRRVPVGRHRGAGRIRPAQGRAVQRAGAAAAREARRGRPLHARLPDHQLGHDDRDRRRALDRDREPVHRVGLDRRRPRQAHLPGARQAGQADPHHQDDQLPHGPHGARARARRPQRPHPRPRRPSSAWPRSSTSSARGSTTSGPGPTSRSPTSPPSSRRPVEPLPARPGHRPHRRRRRRRQGRLGLGLRRPLLLGQRGVRPPVPQLHGPDRRAQRAALPAADARRRPRPGARAEPARGPVPVAHDQRTGVVGVLRGRHRAVPHRRRHLLCALPVRGGDGRRGLPRARRDRHPRRDRAHVGGPRASGGPTPTTCSTSTASPGPTSTRRS